MSQELLYTSAPTGLKSGSRGFATVLCTAGMASNISTRLETLSGYRHVFAPQDPQASLNPVSWSHVRMAVNGQPTSILSRIAAYGVDYSGRTNKLAHHVVPSPAELAQAGPAWMLLQSSWVRTDWEGSCQTPASGPALPSGDQPVAICQRWQQTSGDAGWGGVLAEMVSSSGSKPLWIVFSIDQSKVLLDLINESIALLPVPQRWRATFSTYCTNLPPEIDCKIRCVLAGTEEAKLAPARGTVIDLTKTLATPPSSAYVETARTGVAAKAKAPMPVAPGSTLSSPSSPSLEAINSDDLWPNEILLQPPANRSTPPALAMANKLNLPPQLPGATSSVSGEEGRTRRIRWVIGISALAIILLLSAAIPVILAMKKRADGIIEVAAKSTNAEQDKPQTGKSQPVRNIDFGESNATATGSMVKEDTAKTEKKLVQNGDSPAPTTDSVEQNATTTPVQKTTDIPEDDDSNTDGKITPTSTDMDMLSGNAENTKTTSVPGGVPGKEDSKALHEASLLDVVNPLPDGKVTPPAEASNLPNPSFDDAVQATPKITASLHPNLLFNGKEMRFDFSADFPVSKVTGFFHSVTDDISSLSAEERRLNADKCEFINESVRVIINFQKNRTSSSITGNLYLLKGDQSSEVKTLLKLGEDLFAAHKNILRLRKAFNESSRVPTVLKFDQLLNIDKPILFFDSIEPEVSTRLLAVTTYLKKEKLQENEKSVANANAAMLGEIATNISTARNSIEKINGTLLPLGYLVFNIAQLGSSPLSPTGSNSTSKIHPLTFKLQIPE